MTRFLNKWYGDSCPFWTWPGTFAAVGITVCAAIYVHAALELSACEKKGGNAIKPDGCYLVTMQKIN